MENENNPITGFTPEQESAISKAYSELQKKPLDIEDKGDYIRDKITGTPTESVSELKPKDFYWENDKVLRERFEKEYPDDPKKAYDEMYAKIADKHFEETVAETDRIALSMNIGWGDKVVKSNLGAAPILYSADPIISGAAQIGNKFYGASKSTREVATENPILVDAEGNNIVLQDGDKLEDIYGNDKYTSKDGRKVVALTYQYADPNSNEKPKLQVVYEGERPSGELVSNWDLNNDEFWSSNKLTDSGMKMLPKTIAKSFNDQFWNMLIGGVSLASSVNTIFDKDEEYLKDNQDLISDMSRRKSSKSDYDQEHMASFNNVTQFATDVISQLVLAKGVGFAASMLAKGTSGALLGLSGLSKSAVASAQAAKFVHKATSAATITSLSLMGVDAIKDEARNAGWSEEEAAWLSLAYMGAMLGANSISNLVLNGDDYMAIRGSMKDIARKELPFGAGLKTDQTALTKFAKKLAAATEDATLKLIGSKAASKVGRVGIGASFEAGEEVIEQLAQDGLTTAWSSVKALGKDYDPKKEKLLGLYDPEYVDNLGTQYLLSAAGGALGGAAMKLFSRHMPQMQVSKEDNYALAKIAAMGGVQAELFHESARDAYKKGALGSKEYSVLRDSEGKYIKWNDLTEEQKKSTLTIAEANYRSLLARFQVFNTALRGVDVDKTVEKSPELAALLRDDNTIASKLATEYTDLLEKQKIFTPPVLAKADPIKDEWLSYINQPPKEEKPDKKDPGTVGPLTDNSAPKQSPDVIKLNELADKYAKELDTSTEIAKDLLQREQRISDMIHGRTMERDILDILIARDPIKFKGLTAQGFIDNFGTDFFNQLLDSDYNFYEESKAKSEQYKVRAADIKEKIESLNGLEWNDALTAVNEFKKEFTTPGTFYVDESTKTKFESILNGIAMSFISSTPLAKEAVLNSVKTNIENLTGITGDYKAKLEELKAEIDSNVSDFMMTDKKAIPAFVQNNLDTLYSIAILENYADILESNDDQLISKIVNDSILDREAFKITATEAISSHVMSETYDDFTADVDLGDTSDTSIGMRILRDGIKSVNGKELVNTDTSILKPLNTLKNNSKFFSTHSNSMGEGTANLHTLQNYLFSVNGKNISTTNKILTDRLDEIGKLLASSEGQISTYNPKEEIDTLIKVAEARKAQLELMIDALPYIKSLTKYNKELFGKTSLEADLLSNRNSKLTSYFNKILFNVDEYNKLSTTDYALLNQIQKDRLLEMNNIVRNLKAALLSANHNIEQLKLFSDTIEANSTEDSVADKFKKNMILDMERTINSAFDIFHKLYLDTPEGVETSISKIGYEVGKLQAELLAKEVKTDQDLNDIYQKIINIGSTIFQLSAKDKVEVMNELNNSIIPHNNKAITAAFLSQDIKNYLEDIRTVYADDSKGVLPTMPQETVSFIAYAYSTANEYNTEIDKLSSKIVNGNVIKEPYGENFIKRMAPDYADSTFNITNLLFVQGMAGTGKTQIVAGVTAKAIQIRLNKSMPDTAHIMLAAITEDQVKNLKDVADSYKVKVNSSNTLDSLINLFKQDDEAILAALEGVTTLIFDEATLIPYYKDNDEISPLTLILKKISMVNESRKQGREPKLSMLAFGDRNQASFVPGMRNPMDIDNWADRSSKGGNHSLKDLTNICQTPPLETKFRSYVAVIDKAVEDLLYVKTQKGSERLLQDVGSDVKSDKVFVFQYNNTNSSGRRLGVEVSHGDSMYTDELLGNIKNMFEADDKFTLTIADDSIKSVADLPTNWKEYFESINVGDRVKIKSFIEAQGSERDYILINIPDESAGKSWFPNPNSSNLTHMHRYNELGMLINRARYYAHIRSSTSAGLTSKELVSLSDMKESLIDNIGKWNEFRLSIMNNTVLPDTKTVTHRSEKEDYKVGEVVTKYTKIGNSFIKSSFTAVVQEVTDTHVTFKINDIVDEVSFLDLDLHKLYVRTLQDFDREGLDQVLNLEVGKYKRIHVYNDKYEGKLVQIKRLDNSTYALGNKTDTETLTEDDIRENFENKTYKTQAFVKANSIISKINTQAETVIELEKPTVSTIEIVLKDNSKTTLEAVLVNAGKLPKGSTLTPANITQILENEDKSLETTKVGDSIVEEAIQTLRVITGDSDEVTEDDSLETKETEFDELVTDKTDARAEEAKEVAEILEGKGIGIGYPEITTENDEYNFEELNEKKYYYIADLLGKENCLPEVDIPFKTVDALNNPDNYTFELISFEYKKDFTDKMYTMKHAIIAKAKGSDKWFMVVALSNSRYNESAGLGKALADIESTKNNWTNEGAAAGNKLNAKDSRYGGLKGELDKRNIIWNTEGEVVKYKYHRQPLDNFASMILGTSIGKGVTNSRAGIENLEVHTKTMTSKFQDNKNVLIGDVYSILINGKQNYVQFVEYIPGTLSAEEYTGTAIPLVFDSNGKSPKVLVGFYNDGSGKETGVPLLYSPTSQDVVMNEVINKVRSISIPKTTPKPITEANKGLMVKVMENTPTNAISFVAQTQAKADTLNKVLPQPIDTIRVSLAKLRETTEIRGTGRSNIVISKPMVFRYDIKKGSKTSGKTFVLYSFNKDTDFNDVGILNNVERMFKYSIDLKEVDKGNIKQYFRGGYGIIFLDQEPSNLAGLWSAYNNSNAAESLLNKFICHSDSDVNRYMGSFIAELGAYIQSNKENTNKSLWADFKQYLIDKQEVQELFTFNKIKSVPEAVLGQKRVIDTKKMDTFLESIENEYATSKNSAQKTAFMETLAFILRITNDASLGILRNTGENGVNPIVEGKATRPLIFVPKSELESANFVNPNNVYRFNLHAFISEIDNLHKGTLDETNNLKLNIITLLDNMIQTTVTDGTLNYGIKTPPLVGKSVPGSLWAMLSGDTTEFEKTVTTAIKDIKSPSLMFDVDKFIEAVKPKKIDVNTNIPEYHTKAKEILVELETLLINIPNKSKRVKTIDSYINKSKDKITKLYSNSNITDESLKKMYFDQIDSLGNKYNVTKVLEVSIEDIRAGKVDVKGDKNLSVKLSLIVDDSGLKEFKKELNNLDEEARLSTVFKKLKEDFKVLEISDFLTKSVSGNEMDPNDIKDIIEGIDNMTITSKDKTKLLYAYLSSNEGDNKTKLLDHIIVSDEVKYKEKIIKLLNNGTFNGNTINNLLNSTGKYKNDIITYAKNKGIQLFVSEGKATIEDALSLSTENLIKLDDKKLDDVLIVLEDAKLDPEKNYNVNNKIDDMINVIESDVLFSNQMDEIKNSLLAAKVNPIVSKEIVEYLMNTKGTSFISDLINSNNLDKTSVHNHAVNIVKLYNTVSTNVKLVDSNINVEDNIEKFIDAQTCKN